MQTQTQTHWQGTDTLLCDQHHLTTYSSGVTGLVADHLICKDGGAEGKDENNLRQVSATQEHGIELLLRHNKREKRVCAERQPENITREIEKESSRT